MGFFDFLRRDTSELSRQSLYDMTLMLETAHHMFVEASATLLENEILEMDLLAQDEIVNDKERAIRRTVLELVSSDPQHETVFGLRLVSVVNEAERIGDLAKKLGEIAQLAHKPRLNEAVHPLRKHRNRVTEMFEKTREAFAEGDIEKARAVMELHVAVKPLFKKYIGNLAQNTSLSPNEAIILALAAREMSRIASHLSNIVSSVALPFEEMRRNPTWTEDS